tara:strand:+ start:666 stop:791 length:126 start_codon:yes stop_codon:yes gene_type:complete
MLLAQPTQLLLAREAQWLTVATVVQYKAALAATPHLTELHL